MVHPARTRPQADEISPGIAEYVGRIQHSDVLAVLESQIEVVTALFGAVPEGRAGYRYAPGKWTIREVAGHLGDVERVFAYRALTFARGDRTPLPGFDEDEYMRESTFESCSLPELVQELLHVRRANLALFRHLEPEAWLRRGTANGASVSVRALAFAIAGHQDHHVQTLRDRYGV